MTIETLDEPQYESRQVKSHGCDIQVVTRPALAAKRCSAIPLVLVGGMGTNYEVLEPLLCHLPGFEIVVVEPPGTGESSTPIWPMPMSSHAGIVASVLESMGYQSINVMGLSWGGALAQQLGYEFPSLCRNLVLVSTSSGLFSVPAPLAVLSKYATPRRLTDPDYMAEIAGEIYGGKQKSNPEIARRYARNITKCADRGYYYQLWTITTWTSYPWLGQLQQPTLIVAGNDDPLVPLKNARILADHIPHATLKVLEDGHLLFLNRPAELGRLVASFLADGKTTPRTVSAS